jgi:hypothetical protein
VVVGAWTFQKRAAFPRVPCAATKKANHDFVSSTQIQFNHAKKRKSLAQAQDRKRDRNSGIRIKAIKSMPGGLPEWSQKKEYNKNTTFKESQNAVDAISENHRISEKQ